MTVTKHLTLFLLIVGFVVISTYAQESGTDDIPPLPEDNEAAPYGEMANPPDQDDREEEVPNTEDKDEENDENEEEDPNTDDDDDEENDENEEDPSTDDDDDDEENDDSEEDEGEDELEEPEREFEYEIEEDEVKVKVKIDYSNGDKREIDWELKAQEDGAEIKSEYFKSVNDSIASVNFRIRVISIVEYIPDSIPGFVNDTVVRTYDDWRFLPIQDYDPATLSRTFKLATEDGVFAVVTKLNVNPNDLSLLNITSEDIKIDFEIDASKLEQLGWFSDNGTEISIQVGFISKLKLHKDREDQEGDKDKGRNVNSIVLNTDSDLNAAYFNWLTYLDCSDNTTVDIVSSAINTSTEVNDRNNHEISITLVSFALPAIRPQKGNCVWDPVVGVSRSTIDSSDTSSTEAPISSDGTTTYTSPTATREFSSANTLRCSMILIPIVALLSF